MISIKVNGEFLELNATTRISQKLKSPIFADDNIIPGSYSFPFDIPLSDNNARILGHLDVLENTNCQNEFQAELYFDKVLLQIGKLKINGISATSITTNFVYGFETLSESIKEKTLRDIVSGNSVLLWSPTGYTKTVTLSFGTENTDVYVTINGETYSQYVTNAGDPPTALIAAINAASATNNCVASNVGGKLQLVPFENPTDVETPFNIVADSDTWDVETNIATYSSLVRGAVDDFLSEVSAPNDIIRFPRFKNTGVYSRAEHDTNEVNANINGQTFINSPGGSDTVLNLELGVDFFAFNTTSLCPQVKLSYILTQIESAFDITFSGDFIGSSWYNKALLFNTVYLDIPVPFLGDQKDFIFFKNNVRIADHVPDMKVNEFLKALQTRFNLAVYFNEQTKQIVMNYRNTIATATSYEEFTPISSTPKINNITCLKGVLLKSPKYEDDEYSLVDELLTGTEREQEIETKCKHLSLYTTISVGYPNTFQIPIVNRKQEAKELILFFEHFDLDDSELENTTMSADIIEPTDGYSYATLEANQWDSYLQFLLRRKQASATMQLQLRHLLAIDFEKKYRIAGINYLLNTIDVTLTMQGIEPARVTMYST